MINTDDLCMSCMREIGDEKQCLYCGYRADSPQIPPFLPIRSVIANRYLIGKKLDSNGDGASYIAWDLSSKSSVVVREFFPDSIATRHEGSLNVIVNHASEATYVDCMQSFVELWRKLIRLKGLSALIEIYEVFEENNTAYAVHEHIEGISLREYLLRTPTGYISWDKARPLFMPVLSTLGNLHSAGIIHRGISPTTLLIGTDGKLRISGFSIGQTRTTKSELNSQLFPGYAAIEQYGFEGQQGPWTDIYAFAAVLYRALIGSDPIDATSRITNDRLMIPGKFAEQLPAFVINGLINALQILPEDRTRNVEQCRAELSASPSAAISLDELQDNTQNQPRESSKTPPTFLDSDDVEKYSPKSNAGNANAKKKGSKTPIIVTIIAFIIILFGVGIYVSSQNGFFDFLNQGPTDTSVSENENGDVQVPNFVGRTFSAVNSNAEWRRCFTFSTKYAYDSNVEKDVIISQSVEAYSDVKKGTVVELTISKGPEQIELKNVVGMTYDEAVKLLTGLGFDVEKDSIEEKNNGSQTAGVVYKMSPSTISDKLYPKGTKVILRVWSVPVTTTEPTTEETTIPQTSEATDPTGTTTSIFDFLR